MNKSKEQEKKKEWIKPEIKVLAFNKTEGATQPGPETTSSSRPASGG